jgi:hypothetical protein
MRTVWNTKASKEKCRARAGVKAIKIDMFGHSHRGHEHCIVEVSNRSVIYNESEKENVNKNRKNAPNAPLFIAIPDAICKT